MMDAGCEKEIQDRIRQFQYREAQTFVGCLLSYCMGPIARQRPELWTKRTFMALLLSIYEQLVIEKKEFGPKDYHEIGRTLSEILKGEPRKSGGAGADEEVELSPEALAERFRAAMHRVYGTNFQATDDSPPTA